MNEIKLLYPIIIPQSNSISIVTKMLKHRDRNVNLLYSLSLRQFDDESFYVTVKSTMSCSAIDATEMIKIRSWWLDSWILRGQSPLSYNLMAKGTFWSQLWLWHLLPGNIIASYRMLALLIFFGCNAQKYNLDIDEWACVTKFPSSFSTIGWVEQLICIKRLCYITIFISKICSDFWNDVIRVADKEK